MNVIQQRREKGMKGTDRTKKNFRTVDVNKPYQ